MGPSDDRKGASLTKLSLRAASLLCVAIWAGVWTLFLLLRFSSLDVRYIPGAGGILLSAGDAAFACTNPRPGFARR